ncbi:GNAT family N-acetyltransferase [Pseudomonas petrae]|uniref:GNAT family N-acetyltransferase n=2 Tax=Pseudomonas petrae TaxID=2912190 RepID=A0ABS9I975_9PSED|nr:GNAT family N-acetyltransferase [Pseudomonas petrae]MCF7531016.1 GNAT family N-acetyltransferase [Pseudomonas petrae]MCF7544303.1 GNAT family N-acetyltransferase [Pseudomonas petrae]MCF7554371.1 GNAT family N-acetyltransferase [Pseudomonas petrae]
MNVCVRAAIDGDLEAVASLHAQAFSRQRDSKQWVIATLAAAPRLLAFVLLIDGNIRGYAFWAQKSGLRALVTLELDQIAICAAWQRQGLGARLIKDSLDQLVARLRHSGQTVQNILISTRADNQAQSLYQQVLGATTVATIEGLYSGTEVFMLAPVQPPTHR